MGVIVQLSADLPGERDNSVIAHFSDNHFIVVLRAERTEVVYFDPARGETISASKEQFLQHWAGIILAIDYDDRWLKKTFS